MTTISGGRDHDYRYELLTASELVRRELRVTGRRWAESIYNTVRTGGSMTLVDDTSDIDWLNDRVKVTYILHTPTGDIEYPRGVFLPLTHVAYSDGTLIKTTVELVDKMRIFADAKIGESYTIAAGTAATEAARDLIEATGETKISVTPSAETLPSDMTWEPGATYLQIINDLLDAIGYFSLWVDRSGYFRADPYSAPSARATVCVFDDTRYKLHLPGLSATGDDAGVPTEVVRNVSSADTFWTATASQPPGSVYSEASRGRPIVDVATVEATSQEALQAITDRALSELTERASTIEDFCFPLQPDVDLNSVISLRHTPLGIATRFAVLSMDGSDDVESIVTAKIREVSE